MVFNKEAIISLLKSNKRFTGSYLLCGDNPRQLKQDALDIVNAVFNLTEQQKVMDMKVFDTQELTYTVEMSQDFINFESKRPVSSPSTILILYDIEKLNAKVGDKLLKTIEEPSPDTFMLFTTTNINNVSKTIISRLFTFRTKCAEDDYFIRFKNKYLSFMQQIPESKYEELPKIVESMENLGVFNIIQALFINAETAEDIEIAEKAYQLNKNFIKDQNILKYLVYSYYLKNKGYLGYTQNLSKGE